MWKVGYIYRDRNTSLPSLSRPIKHFYRALSFLFFNFQLRDQSIQSAGGSTNINMRFTEILYTTLAMGAMTTALPAAPDNVRSGIVPKPVVFRILNKI
jgi:hypothetical protein